MNESETLLSLFVPQFACGMEIYMKNEDIKVFIVGTGSIGSSLAAQLSKDGFEVTVIDKDEEIIANIGNTVDAIGYQGNGASYATLKELNASEADILIAVTNSDELNILSCFTAHKLGTKHTIARIRDVDYATQNSFYRDELGISMTINPDLATASEIFRTLRFPAATRVELFAGGRAELVEMPVKSDSLLIGKSLMEIAKNFEMNLLICAVVRNGEAFVPKGNTVIEDKDILYMTGTPAEFRATFKKLKHSIKPLKNVMIAGNDRVTYYLADLLTTHGAHVTIVDSDHQFCFDMATRFPKAAVMKEDALKYFDSMSESDISNTDAFIAVTTNDEYNLIAAMYAEAKGISKVNARISAQSRTNVLHEDTNIVVVSRENVAADRILGYARALLNVEDIDTVDSLYRLVDGQLEFIEFKVKMSDNNINTPLKKIRIKKNILLAGIIRNGRLVIPHGDDMIIPSDVALVATVGHQIHELNDIYDYESMN